jgi:hypothetical protein
VPGRAPRSPKREARAKRGAQGRNRTTDTAIFSRMLYQLSYLGMLARIPGNASGPASRRVIVGPGGAVYHATPSTLPGAASRQPAAARARWCPRVDAGLIRQGIGDSALFSVILVGLRARNDIRTRQPAMQIDVATTRRAERAGLLGRRPTADRAPRGADLTFATHLPRFLAWRTSNPELHEQFYLAASAQPPPALSQPNRIGKPSPPSSVTDSYKGKPTTLE